jgi:hypothetical protein
VVHVYNCNNQEAEASLTYIARTYVKKPRAAGCRWLTPVILATQEARNQEDCNSKPAQENSSQNPISKTPNRKKAMVE